MTWRTGGENADESSGKNRAGPRGVGALFKIKDIFSDF